MKMIVKAFRYVILIFTTLFFTGWQITLSQEIRLQFKHLTVEDGLSNGIVHVIYQDRLGFMWFGTDMGLNKYDGRSVTIYQHDASDTLSIASNFIVDVFEDSYGNFWVGNGYSGLNRFDREREVFVRYNYVPGKKGSISSNFIRTLFEDSKKNLWIGTAGGGLNLYDRKTDSFISIRYDTLNQTGIGSDFIASIAEDQDGYLWIGSQQGILTKFDAETGVGQSYKLYDNYMDLFHVGYGRVLVDSDNDIWFGSEDGLYLRDHETGSFKQFVKGNTNRDLKENPITSILEVKKGIVMIAIDHGGLNIYNKSSGTFNYYMHSKYVESSLSNNQLGAMCRSKDGTIWIASFSNGVNILSEYGNKFQQYRDLVEPTESLNSRNSVLTICEDKDKFIWIGNDGQGIDIIDPKSYNTKHIEQRKNTSKTISSNCVTEIYRDRNDDLWIGTYLEGMSKLNWKTRQYTHYRNDPGNPNSIAGNNVWSILEDKEGFLWIGMIGSGLDRFDRKANKFNHFSNDPNDPNSLSNNDVFKVFEDHKGQIWVGTRNGLCLFNKKDENFTRFMSGPDTKNGLFGGWIYDIAQDQQGNLWIGTDQALNLYHPESNSFEHFQQNEGLNGNAILGIACDKKNNLWISTNKGLSQFNPDERKFRNYVLADGLQSNEFNYTSVLCSSEGKLYFGGKNGFNVFHPDSIKDNPIMPPVYITHLKVLNIPIHPGENNSILTKHINFEKKITLTHEQSVISLEFTALGYSNPENNQYAYWLEGFDDDWNYIGSKHEVTYTNLSPGRYLFKVKASNNDGVWNEKGVQLEIVVLPPWWKTWWFRIIYYSVAAGLLIFIYYLRIAFYRHQQNKLTMLVQERTFQLEEVAVALEEKQEEINSQNEELMTQRDDLESANSILTNQKEQILEQNKELDKHRNQLEMLVEERTRELIVARDKAEESDRLKSSFLANLSHEIRTPLNAILGFSSLLGARGLSDLERKEYNEIIHNSSNSLLDLISDVLDISKIEAGQIEMDLREVSVEAMINDLTGIFDLFLKRDDIGSNKQVQLRVNIEDAILKSQIIVDKLRLEQILSNLLSNAIKFTREGFIELGCKKLPNEEKLEFYVKDTGIGIKEEYQKLIFERFRKVEDDKSNLQRGTGLGLAISSQLVSLLGGSMYLTSKSGEGSVFYFTIPLIKLDSPGISVKKDRISDAVPDFKNCCILVAEDEMSNFKYLEKLLKKAQARVIHAENGKQVIELLQKANDIRLILMDIKMPEMDGVEALREILKMNIKIPVIAQTAYALADDIAKLKREGFTEYVFKPIQREYLYSIIGGYINLYANDPNETEN